MDRVPLASLAGRQRPTASELFVRAKNMKIEISANAVAWYGAIVATFSAILSGWIARRDRTKVKVDAQPNYEVKTDGPPDDETYIVVTVANTGRRPVTISTVGLLPKRKTDKSILLGDSIRGGPHELPEGKATQYLIKQDCLDLSLYKCVVAYDQTGRKWRGKVPKIKALTKRSS